MHGMNYYCDVLARLVITWLSSCDSSFECDRPQTLVEGGLGVASYPGSSKGGGERA